MSIFKGLTFSGALDELRANNKVARRSWDEDYGYLLFVPEDVASGAQAHIVRITPDGKRHAWPAENVPSLPVHFAADVLLAHDYYVVDGEDD